MQRLLILCHHSEQRAGPLMVTIRTVFLGNKETIAQSSRRDISYVHLIGYDALKRVINEMREQPGTVLLFSGIGALRSMSALCVLWINAHYFRSKQIVYWHDAATVLRLFNGLEERRWWRRFLRGLHAHMIWKLLDNGRTLHLVNSMQVKQLALYLTGCNPERIVLAREAIDVGNVPVTSPRPKKEYSICGAGVLGWRKGVDIFIHLARALKSNEQHVLKRATWFGGTQNEIAWFRDTYSTLKFDESDVVFAGHKDNLIEEMQQHDIFLLTSRDDPFPIVGLLALASDMPVFCFDSTGLAEIVTDEFVCACMDDMFLKIGHYLENAWRYEPGCFRKIALKFDKERFLSIWRDTGRKFGFEAGVSEEESA